MKTSVKLIKALEKKCQRVKHHSMFGVANYRVAGEVGISPAGTPLNGTLKPENAFAAGRGGQPCEETKKAKQIAC